MMEMFILVRSSDSVNYFPDNKPGHFRVKLQRPLIFEGLWSVGLCEIHTSTAANVAPAGLLSLHCNTCDGMLVGGGRSNVLRMLPYKRNIHEVYTNVYYMPVETHFIESLEIYFNDSKGDFVSLGENGILECLLHFKQ